MPAGGVVTIADRRTDADDGLETRDIGIDHFGAGLSTGFSQGQQSRHHGGAAVGGGNDLEVVVVERVSCSAIDESGCR